MYGQLMSMSLNDFIFIKSLCYTLEMKYKVVCPLYLNEKKN